MWNSIFDFSRGSLLYSTIQSYKTDGKTVPFTESELNRLRFAIPIALLALWFDNAERAKIREEACEKAALVVFAALRSREFIEAKVGAILALPTELQLAKAAFKPGLFKDIREHVASEEAIVRSIFQFRFNGFRLTLQELWRLDPALAIASRDNQNFQRFEVLSYATGLCAIPSEEAADDRERRFFLTDVFITAQEFFDDVALPAFDQGHKP